ncbi:hypothetical protein [Mucilaginibacter myungsuensis]|uniref:Uncharacterized protein n=1 Tax=Mucilaginibacter myungsuensis TaxID=649104 RepID=A0A929L2A1_9SPHI|nr:hypothetical protein [Mucilaginibacter myungsuensis]MBE9663179.1 hypothetical protein [Mucilaginibacter myungsuensis]MDN3598814.1 hypothetical protein [Mucilaginibacter myungsuensis]
MKATSAWLLNANAHLNDPALPIVFEKQAAGYSFKVHMLHDSCWLVAAWPKGSRIAFRMAYSPNDRLELKKLSEKDGKIILKISSLIGEQECVVDLPDAEAIPVLRLTTTLKPTAPLLFPYWPRDIVVLGAAGSELLAEGEIKVKQVGTRSGQLYFSLTRPKAGSVLYLQNLTALADYNQATETSAGETVGGEWPEIGFALPPTIKNKPLEAGKSYVLSDALIAFSEEVPADEPAMIRQYLDLTAAIYLALPKPETSYKHWPDILQKGLTDLQTSPGCWSQVDGNHYLNAYLSDYKTPPEIMVQLAVLLPLLDYVEWTDAELEMMKTIKDGLTAFYDADLGTIMRWHPKMADKMEAVEEQMQPMVMDSWYLNHPLLNLSRLALKGDKVAEKLFLDSLEFAIKVAHHFDYTWPVFYKMDTLEVVKAETQPGKGGEKDVPGLFSHIMLQAWELTGEKRYLAEAEKSALRLQGLGFELFYQANNTAFSAGAMLRLYKVTGREVYKEISYLCIANILQNTSLWDCNYGYGKNFPSFFRLFPLNDAPYTAAYEEEEVFCALHDYLRHAEGEDMLPSLRLLLAEYIRYLVDRAVYYYPPMLPKEMLSEEVKTGEVDASLWIALEDMHDGWERSGQVGQEVYGAGNAFGILPRHYMQVDGQPFMIYTDYPTYGFSAKKQRPANFRLAGDGRLNSRLMIVKTGKGKLPEFDIRLKGHREAWKGTKTKDGHFEFILPGDSEVHIDWKDGKK